MEIDFSSLLVIVLLAFIVPILASRFTKGFLPIAAAEIIAGIIFGDSVFGLIEINLWIEFLSLFGFALLMFLSGLEVDYRQISNSFTKSSINPKNWLSNQPITGGILFVLTATLAFPVAFFVLPEERLLAVVFLSLVLSTTSVGIVVPALRERQLSPTQYGQVILMSAITADFLTIILLTVIAGFAESTHQFASAYIGLLVLAFLISLYIGLHLQKLRFVQRIVIELAHQTAQLHVRGAIALLVLFVVLAETVGAEFVLGAFLAGAVVSALSRDHGSSMRVKLDAIGFGFFVPVFFVTVGSKFDLQAFTDFEVIRTTILFVVAAFAVKVIPSLLLARRYSMREALGAGMILSSRLSLIIAGSVVGVELGFITQELGTALVAVALVTSVSAPALFSLFADKRAEVSDLILVAGANAVGLILATRLSAANIRCKLVGTDRVVLDKAHQQGMDAVYCDITSADELVNAGIAEAQTVFAVSDDETNMSICMMAQQNFRIHNVIAAVSDESRIDEFARANIKIVSQTNSIALALDSMVERPDLFAELEDISSDSEFVETQVNNRQFTRQRVHDMVLPGEVIVVMVKREDRAFVPHHDTQLELGDLVTIAGEREFVAATAEQMSQS